LDKERQRIEETRQRIVAAHAALDAQNHFELFGLERNANDKQVKEAHARLIKAFHPDSRRDPALSDVADLADRVFHRITEAFEQIGTREARRRYEATLPRPQPRMGTMPDPVYESTQAQTVAMEGSWEAREQLRLAEMSIIADNPMQALELLNAALPRLEGHDLLRGKVAWAKATARNPKALRQAQQVLSELLETHPEAHEAHLVLGDIYRQSRMNARAISSYRKVLEL